MGKEWKRVKWEADEWPHLNTGGERRRAAGMKEAVETPVTRCDKKILLMLGAEQEREGSEDYGENLQV